MTTLSARPLRAMFAGLLIASLLPATLHAQRRTENVVLIVTDGVRWQDVFRGPERRLMSRTPGGVGDTSALIRDFWRDDPVQRRATLLPFLWSTVAKQGVLYGNQDRGSVARITNRFKFSYPGYSGKVGAVATWSVFRNILNEERAGIDVIDGWDEPFPGALGRDPRRVLVNELYRTSLRYWPGNAFDAPMQLAAKEYIRLHKPRLLFVGTARPTSGRTAAATTSRCARCIRSTPSSPISGASCRASGSTAGARPSSSRPTMAAAAAPTTGPRMANV